MNIDSSELRSVMILDDPLSPVPDSESIRKMQDGMINRYKKLNISEDYIKSKIFTCRSSPELAREIEEFLERKK